MANDELKTKIAQKQSEGKQQDRPDKIVQEYLQKMAPEMEKALPRHITPDRMARIALTAIRLNPKLLECTIPSLLGAVMSAAQLGLEPNILGQCYLVPFRDNQTNTMNVQFIIGYQGYIELMYRTGRVTTVYADAVREKDEFSYSFGIDESLLHRPAAGDRGEITHFYAYVKMGGSYRFVVVTKSDVDKLRDTYSKAAKRGPWVTNYEEMGQKTAIRQLTKWVPKSVEIHGSGVTMAEAITRDESKMIFGTTPQLTGSSAEFQLSQAIEGNDDDVDTATGEVVEEVKE